MSAWLRTTLALTLVAATLGAAPQEASARSCNDRCWSGGSVYIPGLTKAAEVREHPDPECRPRLVTLENISEYCHLSDIPSNPLFELLEEESHYGCGSPFPYKFEGWLTEDRAATLCLTQASPGTRARIIVCLVLGIGLAMWRFRRCTLNGKVRPA